jgi:hypothetical protein
LLPHCSLYVQNALAGCFFSTLDARRSEDEFGLTLKGSLNNTQMGSNYSHQKATGLVLSPPSLPSDQCSALVPIVAEWWISPQINPAINFNDVCHSFVNQQAIHSTSQIGRRDTGAPHIWDT